MDNRIEAKSLIGKLGLRSDNYEAHDITTEFLSDYAVRVEMNYKRYLERVAKQEPFRKEYREAHPLPADATDEEFDAYHKAESEYVERRMT